MTFNRRQFLATAVAGAAVASAFSAEARTAKFKAIAFDAFPVFDPRPIFKQLDVLFPGRGNEIANAWRTRQFEYTWLRTAAGKYADFWLVTGDALRFVATQLKLDLPDARHRQIMEGYLRVSAWPDAPAALRKLKAKGLKLSFLSNFTVPMLEAGIRNAKLEGVFDGIFSTDRVQVFKPHPRAYRMAMEEFGLKREEILFVAFAGWDAAGAKMFGYETFWVNRLGLPPEELGVAADGVGRTLDDLVAYAEKR